MDSMAAAPVAGVYAPQQPTVKGAINILVDLFGRSKAARFRHSVTPQITPSAPLSSHRCVEKDRSLPA